LDNTVDVNGNVVIGPSGDTDEAITDCGACISGDKMAASEEFYLPSIAPPDNLTSLGTLSTRDGNVTISKSGQYDALDLVKNSTITIDQDISLHVTGEIYFRQDSSIDIINDASVNIYMDGGLKWNKDGQFNNVSQDPTKLTIFGTDKYDDSGPILQGEKAPGIHIKKATTFYGAIYAPRASITIKGDSFIYGSVVGKKVDIGTNTKIHYDEALQETTGEGNLDYSVTYWQEK
jgi:hypothetical protein